MDLSRLLGIYLNNHLTAAAGGVDLFRRVARGHAGTPLGDEVDRLAAEVEQDRSALLGLMHRLDVRVNHPMTLLGKLGERVGRLKPNGFVVRRSPVSDLVELEALRVAVCGKSAGWEMLRTVAAHDDRITREELEVLIARAEDQADRLRTLHLQLAQRVIEDAEPA